MSDEAPAFDARGSAPPDAPCKPGADTGTGREGGPLRLASLFSGGKDSAYAAYVAQRQMGHVVSCLVSLRASSDESMLLHHPNIQWTELQGISCGLPVVSAALRSDDESDELCALESALRRAVALYGIRGVVHGGIRSDYQRRRFERACTRLGLQVVAPLWHRHDAASYMSLLVREGFDVIITAVSAGGLDDSWLGRHITRDSLCELRDLSERHGFALDFEGGEAETFVADCPMFAHRIDILRHRTRWDGYRGRFEILDAALHCDA